MPCDNALMELLIVSLASLLAGLVDAIVGGGGLIGGVSAVLKHVAPEVEVIGCSPRASHPMHASVAAGEIVDRLAAEYEQARAAYRRRLAEIDDEIDDAVTLAERAEDCRIEYNEIRPHEAIAWNRPKVVFVNLVDERVRLWMERPSMDIKDT